MKTPTLSKGTVFSLGCLIGCIMTRFLGQIGGGSDCDAHHSSTRQLILEKGGVEQKTLQTRSQQLSPAASSKVKTQEDDGWKTVHVYQGRPHLVAESDAVLSARQKWYSQVRQDELVVGLLKEQQNGFFVDLAANHAIHLSNTLALEQLGWEGLCLEPNPEYWLGHVQYRSCKLIGAVVGKKRDEQVVFHYDGVFGGIAKDGFDNDAQKQNSKQIFKAYTVPLLEVFQRTQTPMVIDYLSLDVEGAETYIMSGFPFDQYTFKILTVERPNLEMEALLEKNGFQRVARLSQWRETLWINRKFIDTLDLSVLPKGFRANEKIVKEREKELSKQ